MRSFFLLPMFLLGLHLQTNEVSAETAKKTAPLKNITTRALDSHPTEIDSDGDGKTDIWQTFSWNGKLESATYDNDFDGKADEWLKIEASKKERIQLSDSNKNLRQKITELMDDAGITQQIITESETSKDQWELRKRQTYLAAKKIYKIEIFQNGKLKEEYTTPAEVH
ncbi:MAG: hypothetical protein HYV97_01990 [Bdellovibrio sp.]|nr:hypothetical protein [Bdellovibrio sp.]